MIVPLTPIRCLRYAQEQFSDKTAVVCEDRRFTYANSQSEQVAWAAVFARCVSRQATA